MMMTTRLVPGSCERANSIAMEAMILQLFAPSLPPRSAPSALKRDHVSLWRSDAIHRAKNMAQMTASLANIAEHPSRCWLPGEMVAKTRGLARAYEELGTDCGSSELVPCVPLLVTISMRLVEIFGSARDIAVLIDADTVKLVPDLRRALILMCSELIINALKYGYPGSTGGTIRVTLKNQDAGLVLTVENDGLDYDSNCRANQGSALLDRLSAVLGASLERGSCSEGHGYRVGATIATARKLQLIR